MQAETVQRVHRVQREIYNRVALPLVKYERYPQQDLRFSQPILGRMQPGFKDPSVSALPQVWSRTERKPFRYSRVQQLNDLEIPGVKGSGQHGKDEQQKQSTIANMGDSNKDPTELQKLQSMLSGRQGTQVLQSAKQDVSIPNQMEWR